MKLLQSGHAVVAKAASTDETRYILQSVLIEETEKGMRTVATDGRMLAMVEDTNCFDATDYPANVMPATAKNGATSAMVPTEAFVSAFKSRPKRGRFSLPILDCVAVSMGKEETTLATTDLNTPIVRTAKNIEGNFPNYKQVMPKEKPTLSIKFSPKLLGAALKIAADFDLYDATFEFTDNESPVKITGSKGGQNLTVLVMPVRS